MVINKLDGRIRNLILIVLLALTLVVVSITYSVGVNQDEAYINNYKLYKNAMDLISQQNCDQALQLLNQLDEDSSKSYQVLYMKAVCFAQKSDYETAIDYMQAAREAWPALIQDQKFLLRYGLMLYNHGDYKEAQLYLEQSLKYPEDAESVEEAHKYLTAISKK